jgi:peptidoglycan/xylan/chitin deacetylase (PgdA/CDA1 family)
MGIGRGHAARTVVISMACLVAATLPSTGIAHKVQAPPIAGNVLAVTVENPVEPAGLVAIRLFATPPAPSPPPQLVLVAAKKPPPFTGPQTYVPILLYHYIRMNPNPLDGLGYSLSTPPAMFQMQMQYLADHGFHVVSLHQAVVAIANHTGLPSRPVVLTFDDGYSDFFTQAVPVLLARGFTATDFVISGRIGVASFMTATQVVSADRMGFNIAAHTVDHVALAGMAPARATWEMRQSKVALEALLGHPVIDFAYPYGSFDGYVMGQARSLGFECAVSTYAGSWHWAAQLYDLSRIRLGGGLSLGYFATLMGGPPPTAAELRLQPLPTPTPTATTPPTPSPTASPPTPTPTATPAPTPTPSPTPSPPPSPTPRPSPTPTASATP